MVKFSPITLGDRDICLKLFEVAGWGNTEEDFLRMLHYSPGGCFIADVGVGMVSTVNYGQVGWIGNLIILIAALVALNQASNFTIKHSVKIAGATGFGKATVGFILVAFSTSLPELFVAIFAIM